jgi:1-deoxy-D-xylulose-5-phosphate reductoisomerase
VAVELFLDKRISFLQIGDIIEECMNKFTYDKNVNIEGILETDSRVRRYIYQNYGQ